MWVNPDFEDLDEEDLEDEGMLVSALDPNHVAEIIDTCIDRVARQEVATISVRVDYDLKTVEVDIHRDAQVSLEPEEQDGD